MVKDGSQKYIRKNFMCSGSIKVCIIGNGQITKNYLVNLAHQFQIIGCHFDPDNDLNGFLKEECIKRDIEIVPEVDEIWGKKADLYLLCCYPFILPMDVFRKHKIINYHNSLLPKYRGLHAFVWALLNDEKEVGYTLHQVNEKIDGGPIWYQAKRQVNDSDDINDLFEWINEHFPCHAPKGILDVLDGRIHPKPQDHSQASYFRKRTPEDGLIDWSWPARKIFNLVRALRPPYTPGAFTTVNGKIVGITKTRCIPIAPKFSQCGKIVGFDGESALVGCENTVLKIEELLINGNRNSPKNFFKTCGTVLNT